MADVQHRETISHSVDIDCTHKNQPCGEYARVRLRFSLLTPDEGFEFSIDESENPIPRQWWESVRKAVLDAAKAGILEGGEVVGCRVTFYGGAYHDSDSNADTFYLAAQKAFREGMKKAGPKLVLP